MDLDLIKVNKVKKYINSKELKYEKGLEQTINLNLQNMLLLAIDRAKNNSRRTLMKKDL